MKRKGILTIISDPCRYNPASLYKKLYKMMHSNATDLMFMNSILGKKGDCSLM